MISIKFLFKDSISGCKGEVPSLFNQKKSKYLQQFDSQGLPKSYQTANGFFIKFQKQVPLFNGPKAEKNIPEKRFPTANQKRDFSANVAFWNKKELLNCQRPHLKPPSRDLARTVYTAKNLFFTSFLQW
jgi:hypothetical protein